MTYETISLKMGTLGKTSLPSKSSTYILTLAHSSEVVLINMIMLVHVNRDSGFSVLCC